MGLLDLYDWGLPNQGAHLNRYSGNDQLYNMARSLWSNLESSAIYFMIMSIAIGILIASFYYYVYNRLPGRKYKTRHWNLWWSVTYFLTVIATLVLGWFIVTSSLQEKFGFLLRISLVNGVYAMAIYFIASLIICNIPVPTNAYRFLKIGK